MRLLSTLILGLAATLSLPVFAQGDVGGARPIAVVAIENEAAPTLIVDQPLPGPLAKGQVFIGYRTENIRIVPVYNKGALDVSPRIGHLHVTVDGTPWHWADASNEPIILVGLPPGPHKVLIELADPTHMVISSKEVEFVVPAVAGGQHGH
ncbi:DUF6130 family protein [Massilia sp. CFBP9026]|uniref:DUF6130 family protein n=1 Tax=Massilia sp. CFBP9026 TaxID=3096536 RepID=UPI002A6AADED|nr:DUF6130 family protein [Massilia sp. CFBP9026]MDY0962307.1 DUF6130 family protein [Massilia sp. CFBP9026]